jgi:transcriptional regulator with XRE-family HTH domain
MNNIGSQIKKWREKRGMTQAELAEAIGLGSNVQIYHLESGRRNPSFVTLEKIAKALEVRVEVIFRDGK